MTQDVLRILTLADTPADPDRGAAGTEVRTAEALRALGHQVDSIWSDTLGRRIQHGNLHLLLELPRAYERAVANALRERTYDVLHVNQPHGYLAARTAHRMTPRTVFIHRSHGLELHVDEALAPWRRLHGGDERSGLRRLLSGAIRPLLARHSHAIAFEADGHIVSSSLDARFLEDRLDVDRAKIAVIPQAPPDSFTAIPAPPMTSHRLSRVLHVAQYAFVKAPMIVAAAMELLATQHAELQFTWVCDRVHHRDVRRLLGPRANSRVELLHWMPQQDLRSQYDRCGIFLFPSFFEGFGKAFLEAMSRGACVVASDVGGMHDVVDRSRTGMLVPPGDPEALAAAVTGLVKNPPLAAAMSEAAADAARRYTWDRVARDSADFYRSRLEARR